MRTEPVREEARLREIEPAWRALVARAAEANPLYEPAMALPALNHLAGRQALVWLLVWAGAATRGERLIGLFPLAAERPFAAPWPRAWSLWHHRLGFLTTPLVDREFAAEACAGLAEWLLSAEAGARLFLQPFAGAGGPVDRALRAAFAARGCRIAAFDERTRAALACMPPAAGAGGRQDHGRHRTLRRLRRRLAGRGELAFTVVDRPPELPAAAHDFLALERAGWKGRRGTALDQSDRQRAFFLAAVDAWARTGACRIARLRLGGETIASLVLIVSGTHAWTWKIAHDERYAHCSPGALLMADLTARLLAEREFHLVDSCAPPDYPMVDRLWNGRFALADLFVDLRPKPASAAALVALERARRAAMRPLRRTVRRARAVTRR